jgi:hypothetical protein
MRDKIIPVAVFFLIGLFNTWWVWIGFKNGQTYTIPNFRRDTNPGFFWFQQICGIGFSVIWALGYSGAAIFGVIKLVHSLKL